MCTKVASSKFNRLAASGWFNSSARRRICCATPTARIAHMRSPKRRSVISGRSASPWVAPMASPSDGRRLRQRTFCAFSRSIRSQLPARLLAFTVSTRRPSEVCENAPARSPTGGKPNFAFSRSKSCSSKYRPAINCRDNSLSAVRNASSTLSARVAVLWPVLALAKSTAAERVRARSFSFCGCASQATRWGRARNSSFGMTIAAGSVT